jgi:hypothetical protein
LAAQVDAPEFELLVCANGDSTVAPLVRSRFPDAVVGMTGPARLGAARNFLVDRARGELLLFLDDDVRADPGLLRQVLDLAREWPEVDVFGGPNKTPPGSSRFQVVQGAVLASLMGSGPARRRYGRHPAGPADERFFTLCNLVVRRDVMRPFPGDVRGGEENFVLDELARRGYAMRFDPDLVVYHDRRPTMSAFLGQMFKYGVGRGQLTARAPRTLRPAYAAPSALVIYVGSLPALVSRRIWPWPGRIWLFPLAGYALAVGAGGAKVAWTLRRPSVAPVAAALMAGLHASYGAGVIFGLLTGGRRQPAVPEIVWVVPG